MWPSSEHQNLFELKFKRGEYKLYISAVIRLFDSVLILYMVFGLGCDDSCEREIRFKSGAHYRRLRKANMNSKGSVAHPVTFVPVCLGLSMLRFIGEELHAPERDEDWNAGIRSRQASS